MGPTTHRRDGAGGRRRRKQFPSHSVQSVFYSAFLNALEMYILYTILAALLSFFILKWLKKRRYCTDLKRLDGKTVLITGNVKKQQQQQHKRITDTTTHTFLSFFFFFFFFRWKFWRRQRDGRVPGDARRARGHCVSRRAQGRARGA